MTSMSIFLSGDSARPHLCQNPVCPGHLVDQTELGKTWIPADNRRIKCPCVSVLRVETTGLCHVEIFSLHPAHSKHSIRV